MSEAIVIAIVGAESTGKSTLAQALAKQLSDDTGLRCTSVDEYLRTWCNEQGRVPRVDEQRAIAQTQQDRIAAAAASHEVVIADTTAVMIAVYSRLVYGDASLDAWAGEAHRRLVTQTLLTGLDLPWVPDGLQRDGPHVRAPVDALVRELLAAHGIGWSLISGTGAARLEAAVDAVAPLVRRRAAAGSGLFSRLAQRDAAQARWQWVCETCDDPDCEHRLRAVTSAP